MGLDALTARWLAYCGELIVAGELEGTIVATWKQSPELACARLAVDTERLVNDPVCVTSPER